MATKSVARGIRARRADGERTVEYLRLQQKYATRKSMLDTQGSRVTEVVLRGSGRTFIVRRVSLFGFLQAGLWPKPITQKVRRMMIVGNIAAANESEDLEDYLVAARALAKEAVIVPPEEFLLGEITVAQIIPETCKPLYVDVDPDEDQVCLLPEDEFVLLSLMASGRLSPEAVVVEPDDYRQMLAKGEAPERLVSSVDEETRLITVTVLGESGALKLMDDYRAVFAEDAAKAADWARGRLGESVSLHWGDLSALAGEILDLTPGANSKFRPVPQAPLGKLVDAPVNRAAHQ